MKQLSNAVHLYFYQAVSILFLGNSFVMVMFLTYWKEAPVNIYLFKVSHRKNRKGCEICSKLTIQTAEQCQSRCSCIFIVNFEHISHLFLVFLLLTSSKLMLAIWRNFSVMLMVILHISLSVIKLKLDQNEKKLTESIF